MAILLLGDLSGLFFEGLEEVIAGRLVVSDLGEGYQLIGKAVRAGGLRLETDLRMMFGKGDRIVERISAPG